MVDARQEVIDELETFEKDYTESFDDENFDNESAQTADLDKSSQGPEPVEGEPETEEVTEVSQESDSGESDQSGEKPTPKPKMVTLPDDADAFGEFAGQKISYDQLAEEGLVDNLVTWGHQGRHMIGRGQEELDEAKRMREVLEKQLDLQTKQVQDAAKPPPATPEQHAAGLVERYLPEMVKYAEAGGVEPTFLENYPKAAAYMEDRFQAAAKLGNVLVKVIDDLKTGHDTWTERDTSEAGKSRLRTLANEVSESNELFDFVGKDDGYKNFMKWATAEDSTLHWVDRDVENVTAQDIQASVLLYMHQHPDEFKKTKPKATPKERQLASGGTGQTRPTSGKQDGDEMSEFEAEYAESFVGQDY